MSTNEDLVAFLRSEFTSFRSEFTSFRTEVKQGLTDLSQRIDQTNIRLDQTNVRLDQTNIRLDASINMTRDFRKDVADRLDHIGGYLQTINGNILNHEMRIAGLEQRVDHLEQTG